MKLSDYKQAYYEFSGKASDVARNAAFAGIAIVWIFKFESEPIPRIPSQLYLPTALFVISLGLDLLHYISGGLIWGFFHWFQQRKLANPSSEDPDMSHPNHLGYPLLFFFVLKLLTIFLAYIFLGIYVIDMWLNPTQQA